MNDDQNYYYSYWQEKCRWPECSVTLPERDWQEVYRETVEWLYTNIENCERHCRWKVDVHSLQIYGKYRFRHEIDMVRFSLRWL